MAPLVVFGILLLEAGSHVRALPWHLACTPLPQTWVVYPQEAQICSLCGPRAWLAVAVATHLQQRETNHSTCKDAFSNQPCSFKDMILPLEQIPNSS